MTMPEGAFREVLPKRGLLFTEAQAQTILCKPKLLPLKSFTLQRLEEMQNRAKERAREQMEERQKEEDREKEQQRQGEFVSESVSFE